jgi:hypothetical protein
MDTDNVLFMEPHQNLSGIMSENGSVKAWKLFKMTLLTAGEKVCGKLSRKSYGSGNEK